MSDEPNIRRFTTTCPECGAPATGESECFIAPVDYAEDGTMVLGGAWAPIVGQCAAGHIVMESEATWRRAP